MRILILFSIVISLLLIPLAGCGGTQTCPKIGDRAPDFTLPGIDGKSVSLSDFSGKPVIINTWSISCIECKKEMPYFQEIYNQYAPGGLVFLSVNTLDSTGSARDFLSKNGYTFTVLFDLKNEIYKKFCCPKNADPNTFFIGADGTIKAIKIGGFASKDELANEVNKIMQSQ